MRTHIVNNHQTKQNLYDLDEDDGVAVHNLRQPSPPHDQAEWFEAFHIQCPPSHQSGSE